MFYCPVHGVHRSELGCRRCQADEVNRQHELDLARIDRETELGAIEADDDDRREADRRESYRYDACDRHLKWKRSCPDCQAGIAEYERVVAEEQRPAREAWQRQRDAEEAERERLMVERERVAQRNRDLNAAAVRWLTLSLAVAALCFAVLWLLRVLLGGAAGAP